MMRRLFHILPLVLAGSVSPESLPPTQYVDSRRIVLSCEAANGTAVDRVRVWVSPNDDGAWREAKVRYGSSGAVCYEAQDDGKYVFYIVLENKAGRSAPAPTAGSRPQISVTVDTAAPTLQIHAVRRATALDGRPVLSLRVTLVDENLGDAGTRLFYRASGAGGWLDAGSVIHAAGMINWRPPAGVPGSIDIRIVATDRAGNQAVDEIRNVSVEWAKPSGSQQSPTGQAPELKPLTLPEVSSVSVAPVQPVTLADSDELARRDQPSVRDTKRAELLREQALRFLAENQFPLAGARLQEALRLTPNNPDLHVDLARTLYSTEQYDRAAHHYQLALEAYPEHVPAIEGLALVAVGQRRYADARTRMQHVLRLCPDAAEHWLHLGDVEHMLGNNAEARAAWNKALQLDQAGESVRDDAQKRLKLFGQK